MWEWVWEWVRWVCWVGAGVEVKVSVDVGVVLGARCVDLPPSKVLAVCTVTLTYPRNVRPEGVGTGANPLQWAC